MCDDDDDEDEDKVNVQDTDYSEDEDAAELSYRAGLYDMYLCVCVYVCVHSVSLQSCIILYNDDID